MPDLRIATFGTGYFSQCHYDAWSRLERTDGLLVVHKNCRFKP